MITSDFKFVRFTMVVALPPQPTDARVILPLVPHDPPTLEDISSAVDFRKSVTDSSCKFYTTYVSAIFNISGIFN